jgi:4-hydroxy-4-methyl-2-oxoglutarate aldolase
MARVALSELVTALVGNAGTPCRRLQSFEFSALGAHCAGEALTVSGRGGDNLALYRGIERAEPGQVLVVALGGSREVGHWGSLMTQAAIRAQIAGVVIDGAVRDRVELAELGLPVFFRGSCPLTAGKDLPGEIGSSAIIDGVEIRSGELIVADADAVVAVDPGETAGLVEGAAAVLEKEAGIVARLQAGEPLGDAFGLHGLD